jgi:FkbM family methyltransferase
MVFEPVSEFVTSIERRFRANPNISVHRFGLGKTSRVETISLCADGSSVFRESGKTERIEIVDIAEWLRRNTISRIDLMKVNIEGGEYELLERLIETGMIEGVRNLQVQFHQMSKESVCRMERIQECLKSTHHPTYQYRFVWENWVSNDK